MITGNRIKELRTIANMSQEELGRRVGVQRAAIQKYEKGSVTNIPIATLEKLASTFDVSPSYLAGWDETSSNPLSAEVRIIQGVQHFYGKGAVELLEAYVSLDRIGKKRVDQYLSDMSQLYSTGLN